MADVFAQREVLTVVVDEHAGFLEFEFAGLLIYIARVGTDVEYVGYKHVVTSKVSDTLDSTFNA